MIDNLAKYIDHTLLKPEATKEDIETLIQEAMTYNFYSVCVHPYWVSYCHEQLKNTSVEVCTVIGFPLGASATQTKVSETILAIKDGATEIDMVINIGELKAGNDKVVEQEIAAVVQATNGKALTKVIIETSLLTKEEIIKACQLSKKAHADFVKTSTGFSSGGATVSHIKLMRETVGNQMGVKASGGVRDRQSALAMIEAGATRIGASSSINIVKEN